MHDPHELFETFHSQDTSIALNFKIWYFLSNYFQPYFNHIPNSLVLHPVDMSYTFRDYMGWFPHYEMYEQKH